MNRKSSWALALAALGLAARAGAQVHSPGIWERAADPQRAVADKVHREVEQLLITAQQLQWHTPMGQETLSRAMQKLDSVRAEGSPDVRLRFDFGRVAELLRDCRRAAPALRSAVTEAPDHPLASQAFFSLGICLAMLDRPDDEIAAYDEFLSRETDPGLRATAFSNRAEAQMHRNRLVLAIDDYRAALALEPGDVLAHWGLAITLDRNGDTSGGIAEAKLAFTYDPLDQSLTNPNVFFVPAYDIYWYQAIGAMARAQQVDDAGTSILWWETAMAKWTSYVAVAASEDRWLPLARAHQSTCRRQLEQAKKRAARAPKPRHPSHADDTSSNAAP